ncbi:hypothetical protein M413DRAFT_32270 [Hebeloma cylindrosporum]|uniref:Zinc finger GRF-type domain-containing protein n=1 Tax=Hebeloma cylindrosporum TaxID=76867 RepID=A0A0C3BG50_HEBCY|nr:hypothetical protein M413DRAFT_32270 [Hebeloma cylindrosporum h7]
MPLPKSLGSRSRFMDLVVPKWRIPRCSNGNPHRPGICMGTKRPEDFGRRYFFCDSKAGKAARCNDQSWSPVLSEESCERLKVALKVFTKAMYEDPLKVFESAAKLGMQEAAGPKDQDQSTAIESEKVLIYVYISKDDEYLKYEGVINDGFYSFLSDITLCGYMHFPHSSWSIYDRFREGFNPIPTYSAFKVIEDEFFIVRPTSFLDENCQGLGDLITRLHSLPMEGMPAKGSARAREKRKRAVEEEGSDAGPSKRKKPNLGVQETVVLDWTDL